MRRYLISFCTGSFLLAFSCASFARSNDCPPRYTSTKSYVRNEVHFSWDNTYDWQKCSYLGDSKWRCGSRKYSYNRNFRMDSPSDEGSSGIGVYSSDPNIGEFLFLRRDRISDQDLSECKESAGILYCIKEREIVSAYTDQDGSVQNVLYRKTIQKNINECREIVL